MRVPSPMRCNIDKRGQIVRLVAGLLLVAAGIALGAIVFVAALPAWVYVPAAIFVLSGAFSIFEARARWCAVRALGIRTPV